VNSIREIFAIRRARDNWLNSLLSRACPSDFKCQKTGQHFGQPLRAANVYECSMLMQSSGMKSALNQDDEYHRGLKK
jgi:hypothetical protein